MISNRKNNQGYAIVIVLVLLVIGTAVIMMYGRDKDFFSKVSGFLYRSRQLEMYSSTGIQIAINDLQKIANNSRDTTSGVDIFTTTAAGGAAGNDEAYNMGLWAWYTTSSIRTRTIIPRFIKNSGDLELRIYYFPENPCTTSAPATVICSNDSAYNLKFPKTFRVVSQVTSSKTGEIFTTESQIQVKFANYSEITFGIEGLKCINGTDPNSCGTFPNNNFFDFAPSPYGTSYFDLPANKLRFVFNDAANLGNQSQQTTFSGRVYFKNKTPMGQDYPFLRFGYNYRQHLADGSWNVTSTQEKAMVNFKQGLEDNVPISTTPATNPSSSTYFTQMSAMATTGGQNLSSGETCPASPNMYGKKEVHICLKAVGSTIKKYPCNKNADDFMGRLDENKHPPEANSSTATANLSNLDPSTAAYRNAFFVPGSGAGTTTNDWLGKGLDRYVGERADVINNTDSSLASYATSGVFYCHLTDCHCKVHVKGIYDGNVNFVADDIVIEGDNVLQDQTNASNDIIGMVAKYDVEIPEAIPQAATSAPSSNNQNSYIYMQDIEPPFTNQTGANYPGNFAEAYLGITNFIPKVGGTYKDQYATNTDYAEFAKWDLSQTGGKVYASPTVLDLQANIYAGNNFKVGSLNNPYDLNNPLEVDNPGPTSTPGSAMPVITVDNPSDPRANWVYSYRNPLGDGTHANDLYDPDQTTNKGLLKMVGGQRVQPLYYVDGLAKYHMTIEQGYNKDWNGRYTDTAYNPAATLGGTDYYGGEETPRVANRGIAIFGSVHSKYSYINDVITGPGPGYAQYKIGFRKKLVQADPRSFYLRPVGFPDTAILKVYELYTKQSMGKSALVP